MGPLTQRRKPITALEWLPPPPPPLSPANTGRAGQGAAESQARETECSPGDKNSLWTGHDLPCEVGHTRHVGHAAPGWWPDPESGPDPLSTAVPSLPPPTASSPDPRRVCVPRIPAPCAPHPASPGGHWPATAPEGSYPAGKGQGLSTGELPPGPSAHQPPPTFRSDLPLIRSKGCACW